MWNGLVYHLPAWGPTIVATAPVLWPTPRACNAMSAELTPKMAAHRRLNLEVAMARALVYSAALGGPPSGEQGWWQTEPPLGRVAHGVPGLVHRLRALGNAVVPQVVTLIGHRLLQAEKTIKEGDQWSG